MKKLKIKNGEIVFPLRERIRYFFQKLWMRWILGKLEREREQREKIIKILKGDG